jgi:hypothetical protein
MSTLATQSETASPLAKSARAITWRSLLLGTLASVVICTVTPFNDLVLSDTSMAAGFLPLAIVLTEFFLVVILNAPLAKWKPQWALSTPEMAVIVLMGLIASSLPNWGMARFFVPMPVSPFRIGSGDEQFWKAFVSMDLPGWLFPVPNVAEGRSNSIATWFYSGVPEGESIPWSAWVRPLLVWGVFAAGMIASLAALSRLLIKQWAVNERLPFPLVQVQASLIESPPAGRGFNSTFAAPLFWIGLAGVFLVLMLSCLNAYFPKNVPSIPLRYDLSGVLSEEPFFFLRTKLKKAAVSFAIVGLTFFVRSRVAFSLWATYFIINLVDVQQGMMRREMTGNAWADQHFGAAIAFAIGIAWVGRAYWIRVIKSAFGFASSEGTRVAFWVFVAGLVAMVGWLNVVGVRLQVGTAIVGFILLSHLIVARVVAETGLPLYRSSVMTSQLFSLMPSTWFALKEIFFSSVFTILGPITSRDSITTFGMQGLAICKTTGAETETRKSWLGAAMALALVVGFICAVTTTLYCQYSYPTPATPEMVPQRNFTGSDYFPRRDIGNPTAQFARSGFAPKQHDPYLHMGIGFSVTTLLEVASLRWASWPFLPVGYVAQYGAFLENAWFSVFIGWIAQVLVVRLGGASLFQKMRPFFIGIIFGEGLAAGLWLLANAIVVFSGGESQTVRFLF